MAKKQKYYTVVMSHFIREVSYELGIFDGKHKAIKAAKEEWVRCGSGKYIAEIREWEMNNTESMRLITY